VVTADADPITRTENRATLADYDFATAYGLSRKDFYAEPLGLRIATIS